MPFALRPELTGIRPVVHGSAVASELLAAALDPSTALDFSASTNPLGPSPRAVAALRALSHSEVWRYPDPTAAPLRRALANRLEVDPETVVVGNGSAELIWSVALAGVHPAPDGVIVAGPTFGEYERASRLLGASVEHVFARPEVGFRPDVPHLVARIRAARPRLVWLCSPNNPTGQLLSHRALEEVVRACAGVDALLVLDEAYLAFVDGPERDGRALLDLLPGGHLVLLRSLTKDLALAGVRLGYGLATSELAAALRLTQPPWSVGAPAQVAGLAALADDDHLQRARETVRTARARLVSGLQALGLRVTPPAANFLLVEVGDARAWRAALLARGCVVRDCTSFGLPGHVRIGVRVLPECERLLDAMGAVLPTLGAPRAPALAWTEGADGRG